MADDVVAPNEGQSPETVDVYNPQGELVSIPKQQMGAALSAGYSSPEGLPTSGGAPELQEEFGTGSEQLKTLAEHAASSATFGLSSAFQKSLDPTFAVNALKRSQANPGVSLLGDIAGLTGSSLAGVGEGAVLNEAGQSVREALGLSGEGLSFGQKILGSAAQGAVEAGGFQAGDEVTKVLQDPDYSLSTAMTNVGLYGLLGGATLGAGLGAVNPLWEATAGKKLGQVIEDFKGRIKERANVPDPVQALTEELTDHVKNSEAVFDEVYGAKGLKNEAIEKAMPNQLSDLMVKQAQEVLQKAKNFTIAMESDPDLYPRGLSAKFNRDTRILTENLSQPAEPGQIFSALNDFKQRLQGAVDYGWQGVPKEQQEFVNSIKNMAYDLRKGLESSDVWGKVGDIQQDINKAFREYQTPLKQFRQKFMTKVNDQYVVDPGKLQTYINQTGKAGQKIKQEMLGNFLEADAAYRKAVDSVHEKIGSSSPFEPSSLQFAKSTLQELTPGAKLADAVINKGLSRLTGETLGIGIGGAIGHSMGSGMIGALIGEHALAPFFNSILPSIFKPLMEAANNPGALKSAIDYGVAVAKGETLVNKATKALFQSGKEVLPSTFIPDQKTLDKLDSKLADYQTNPSAMLEMGGQLGHYQPAHATALGKSAANTVNVVNSLRPALQKQSPLDREPEMTKAQKAEWQRTLSIAEQPLMVLKHIKDGTLQAKDVALFNSLNPALHQKIISKITEEMANHLSKDGTIPYQERMGLSLLLAHPLDSTLTPESIMSSQMTFQQNASPTQQAPDARGGRAHSMKALSKISEIDRTPSQARQMARSK